MSSNTQSWLTVEISSETKLIGGAKFRGAKIGGDVKKSVIEELKKNLIISNPIYEDKQRRGYWVGNTPTHLTFLKEKDGCWTMPRGFTTRLISILLKHKCYFVLDINKTREFTDIDFTFHGKLKKAQMEAADAILTHKFCVIQLPTGAGKTVLALVCISGRKQPALVIVHTKELLYQWKNAAKKFLELEDDDIGLLGDGHKKVGKKLTIAIINTLKKMVSEVKKEIGFLVVDECHKVPATTFYETVSQFDCRYMLGITATPERTDRLTELIHLFLGSLVYKKAAKEAQNEGLVIQPSIRLRQTNFDYPCSDDYQQMIAALTQNEERNKIIVNDIEDAVGNGTKPILVVSDRKSHCDKLTGLIRERDNFRVELLTGSVAAGKRKKIVQELNAGNVDVLVATTSLIGEGFDCKSLSALFLTTPISSKPKLKQVMGRVLRKEKGKKRAVVYDYEDNPGVLQASLSRRIQTYNEEGAIVNRA